MGNSVFKTIIIAICCAAFIVLCVFIAQDHFAENDRADMREAEYKEVNDSINELYTRRDALNEQMEAIQKDIQDQNGDLATLTLLFTSPERDLMEAAAEALHSYSYPGNIAVSKDAFPGDEDCISTDELKTLIDLGWEITLAPHDADEVDALCTMLEEVELPFPTAIVLYSKNNADEILKNANAHGITIIFAPAELELDISSRNVMIPVQGYRADGSKDITQKAIENCETIAFCIGPKDAKITEAYDAAIFDNMMAFISKNMKSTKSKVTTAQEAADRYRLQQEIRNQVYIRDGNTIEKIQKELDEVNACIQAIHDQY